MLTCSYFIVYCHQILGNTQEALESYTDIIKKNLDDELSLAVAINNLIALKGPKDISDGLRKLDKLIEKGDGTQKFQLTRGLDIKLSPKQKESVYLNRMLLLLHSNKMDQVIFISCTCSLLVSFWLSVKEFTE